MNSESYGFFLFYSHALRTTEAQTVKGLADR